MTMGSRNNNDSGIIYVGDTILFEGKETRKKDNKCAKNEEERQ